MKVCKKCRTEKQERDFYPKMGRCKACHNIYARNWQKSHPVAAKRIWTKFNREKRNKFRYCPICGNKFKFACIQKECSDECKFWNSIEKRENGCWDWKKGRDTSGYGLFCKENKHLRAHRKSYEIHYGDIPEGKYVCHTCDRPMCVNPAHLFLGTHKDNMDDMNKKGRGNAGRAHFRKYSREQCHKVISLRKQGKLFREIAEVVGIPEHACKRISKHPERIGAT